MAKRAWLGRMILEIFSKIFKQENLIDFDIFIKNYQTFEEIPLVSRYEHLDIFKKKIKREDLQSFLINTAFFLLNNIEFYAKNKLSSQEYNSFFICITFSDLEEASSLGYVIPNLFVTRKKDLLCFLKTSKELNLDEFNMLSSAFDQCGLKYSFDFIKTINKDSLCGNFVRIYAINHINMLKLSNLKM